MSPLFLAFGVALAAEPSVCRDLYGNVDPALTADWQRRFASSDPASVRLLVGTWVNESYNAQVNMTVTTRITYLETGVMEFATRTCGTMAGFTSCSDDYGHGLFAAQRQPDGSLFVTRNIRSLTRTDACGGNAARVQGATLIDATGGTWQKAG